MVLPRRRITRLLVTAAPALGGPTALSAQQAAAVDTGVPNGDVIANLWDGNGTGSRSLPSARTFSTRPGTERCKWSRPPSP